MSANKGVRSELEELNKPKSAGAGDIHPAIIKPLADILTGPVCKLFQSSIDQGEISQDWRSAVIVELHETPNLIETSGQSASPTFHAG